MLRRTVMFLVTGLASTLMVIAAIGTGPASWAGFYQPAPPK